MKKSDTRWLNPDYITQELAVEIDDILTRGCFPRKRAIKQAIAPITSGWVDWLNDNMRKFFESFQTSIIRQMEDGMGGASHRPSSPWTAGSSRASTNTVLSFLNNSPKSARSSATLLTAPSTPLVG